MSERFKEIYHYELDLDLAKEWKVVEQKLDKKKRRLAWLWWAGAGLLLVGIGMISFSLWSGKTAYADRFSQTEKSNEIEYVADASQGSQVQEMNSEVTRTTDTEANPSRQDVNPRSGLDRKAQSSKKIQSAATMDSTTEKAESNESSANVGNQAPAEVSSPDVLATVPVETIAEAAPATIDLLEIQNLPVLAFKPEMDQTDISIDMALTSTEAKPEILNRLKGIGLSVMYGVVDRKLTGDNPDYLTLRNETESEIDVMKVRLAYDHSVTDLFGIGGGLEWTQITEMFEFKGKKEAYIVMDNQITETSTDVHGVTTTSKGQLTSYRKYDINVLKYNTLRTVSVPIYAQANLRIGKSRIQLITGLNQPVYQKYSGLMFAANGAPTDLMDMKNLKYNYTPRVFHGVLYNYPINKSLRIHGGLNFEYDLSNAMIVDLSKQSYQTTSVQAGINYHF